MIWNLGRTSGRADNDSLQSGHVWPRHAETCWSCGVWSRSTPGRSTSPRPNDRFGTKLLLPHHLREKFGPSVYFRCYGLLWVLGQGLFTRKVKTGTDLGLYCLRLSCILTGCDFVVYGLSKRFWLGHSSRTRDSQSRLYSNVWTRCEFWHSWGVLRCTRNLCTHGSHHWSSAVWMSPEPLSYHLLRTARIRYTF